MNSETIASSRLGRLFIGVLAAGMESPFRYRFFGPMGILRAARVRPGQHVLEIGCGTGYFTIPAARLIGSQGALVAMDLLKESVALVSSKVRATGLKQVRVLQGDATHTGLDPASFDVVLLFGVIPAPMLPLARLLPEMYRVLKPGGRLAVWPTIPGWLPDSINCSGLFTFVNRRSGVSNFERCSMVGSPAA